MGTFPTPSQMEKGKTPEGKSSPRGWIHELAILCRDWVRERLCVRYGNVYIELSYMCLRVEIYAVKGSLPSHLILGLYHFTCYFWNSVYIFNSVSTKL